MGEKRHHVPMYRHHQEQGPIWGISWGQLLPTLLFAESWGGRLAPLQLALLCAASSVLLRAWHPFPTMSPILVHCVLRVLE